MVLDNTTEKIQFDKITRRIEKLCYGLDKNVIVPTEISKKVIAGTYNGISTSMLDNLAAEICASRIVDHPHYAVLASRIAVSNCHKNTSDSFYETSMKLRQYDLIDEEYFGVVRKMAKYVDRMIDYSRDYTFDYFGFKTLERTYLLGYRHSSLGMSEPDSTKVTSEDNNSKSVTTTTLERPQHMFMRVAIFIHREDVGRVFETYDLMSRHVFIHATPTLFAAGTRCSSLSSCFLTRILDDSIDGIYDTLKDCALITKSGGGIGLSVTNVRCSGSRIIGTNGSSNGIVPMLRVFGATSHYVDQGGNKRPGAIAIYLEPWHADIFEFLDLRKNTGSEYRRARELFYALWIPDIFMRRVRDDEQWPLFCPSQCPLLLSTHGEQFDRAFLAYENDAARYVKQRVPARKLWQSIVTAQIETGMPFMLYKDKCNAKSNHNHLGTISCSNLCTEIVQYSDGKDEIAVCNLASISLPSLVCERVDGLYFCHESLRRAVHVIVRNLNRVIDVNHYPCERARRSNLRHRPIGIGVQGLADTFAELGFPFESNEARDLNIDIFETIYFAALEASCSLAREYGRTYDSYVGSPVSRGILQFDMWPSVTDLLNVSSVSSSSSSRPETATTVTSASTVNEVNNNNVTSAPSRDDIESARFVAGILRERPRTRWNWQRLRDDIARYGLYNSLLVSPMPTASTAQILGNNESIDPIISNIFLRRVLSGEYTVINKRLLNELIRLGLWNQSLRDQLIANSGSIQNIDVIPQRLKNLFKTAWEISQKTVLLMAAERGIYVDQSQSLNVYLAEPSPDKLTSMHFFGWRLGLKTGMYYLRTQPAARAIQFTLKRDRNDAERDERRRLDNKVCSLSGDSNECFNCSA